MIKKRGPKIKKLNSHQKAILAELTETYIYWKEARKKLNELYLKALKSKIPITHLGKALGLTKQAIEYKYKNLK